MIGREPVWKRKARWGDTCAGGPARGRTPTVEEQVALFMPAIIARYGLPLVWIRRAMGPPLLTASSPERGTVIALGFGVMVMLCLAAGLATTAPKTRVFLECWKHVAVLLAVATGLLWGGRASHAHHPELADPQAS